MSAYGIAGLVDGFFKGRELKHGWEDRKDAKKRQEMLDGYYEKGQQRLEERHGWDRGNHGRAVSDYDRARADDDAYRTAAQEAYDAALGAPPPAEGQTTATSTSGMEGPPPGPASEVAGQLGVAVDEATRRSASADQFERNFDPTKPMGAPQPAPAGPRRADASPQGPAFEMTGRGEQINTPQGAPQGPDWEAQGRGEPPVQRNYTPEEPENQISGQPAQQQRPDGNLSQDDFDRLMQDPRLGAAPQPDPRAAFNPSRMGQEHLTPFEKTEAEKRAEAEENARNLAILEERAKGPRLEQPASRDRPEFDLGALRRQAGEAIDGRKPNYSYDWGKDGLAGDVREAARRGGAMIDGALVAATNAAITTSNGLNSMINPALKYATGGENGVELPYLETVKAPRQQLSPEASQKAIAGMSAANSAALRPQPLGASPNAAGPRISNVPANAAPVVKQMADTATSAMGEASTPAIQAAAAEAAKTGPSLGAAGNKPYTEKQRERASTSFLDRYREVGAPIVIKEFLRRGQVDKAVAFQEFMDKGEVKAGMKNWARASFAASVGDFDSFAEEIIEGYNRLDYFGDDTTIVKDKSGFTDANGNITKKNADISGAKIVFKDEKTGKTFEQTYENPDDIVTMGITLLAPEQAFEYWVKKTEAAKEAALGAVKEQQGASKDRQERVDKAAAAIFKASSDSIDPGAKMTWEEAMAEAERSIPGGAVGNPFAMGAPSQGEGSTVMPPVMRRP